MIKALIFDFDGVIVDSEPLHFKVFQRVLEDEGIYLSKEDYISKYLAYDDKTFFSRSLSDFGKYKNPDQISKLINKKSKMFETLIRTEIKVFPGVLNFLKKVNEKYPSAIGSGALRSEIVLILKYTGLAEYFDFIVSADEVENCKPDPQVYLKVLNQFNIGRGKKLLPIECLVFEDALHGIAAAKSAGMNCVGVSNSYSGDEILGADFVISSFEKIDEGFLNNFD
ncbi:MAG: HAD family hydrolase [Thermodesulfobacteriota bacterium]